MAADYWIKLYHEIIDDPKMATLPDRLWRRTIELFLLAGKYSANKSGNLPDTRQLAWALRMPMEELQLDMEQLTSVGIIERITNGWLVVNFEKRQNKLTDAERQKQYRERQKNETYYGNTETPVTNSVTLSNGSVTQINRLTDNRLTESEAEAEGSGNDFNDDVQELLDALPGITKLPLLFGGMEENVEAVKEMVRAGVLVVDMEAGAAWMTDQGRKIVSARSLVKPSIVAMANRKRGGPTEPVRKLTIQEQSLAAINRVVP